MLLRLALPTMLVALACSVVSPQTATPGIVQVAIYANKGWQDTGLVIAPGQQISIEYVSGLWFEDPPDQWHDASGGPNAWTCTAAECHEPLPNFPKYALIGKIGESDTLLRIGNRLDWVAEVSGPLYLRANYGDEDIAIFNPEGAVTVKITSR